MNKFDINETKIERDKLHNIQVEVLNTLDDIRNLYLSLHKKVWDNKEKTKLDEIFYPFLNKTIVQVKSDFDVGIKLIDLSINTYQEEIAGIKKSVGDNYG